MAHVLGADQARRARRQGAQEGVHFRLGGIDAGLEYVADSVDVCLHVPQLVVVETAGGLDIVFQPVGDEGDGGKTIGASRSLQAVDFALHVDEVGAPVASAAVHAFDDRVDFVKLVAAALDIVCLEALKRLFKIVVHGLLVSRAAAVHGVNKPKFRLPLIVVAKP